MVANYSSGLRDPVLHAGVILTTTKTKAGYHVQQNKQTSSLDFNGGNDWADFTTTVGVVKVTGLVNRLSFDTVLGVNIGGICLGSFTGNPQISMTVNIDLDYAVGSLELTAIGDDIWLQVDLGVLQIDQDNQARRIQLCESVCVTSIPQEMCEPWIPYN